MGRIDEGVLALLQLICNADTLKPGRQMQTSRLCFTSVLIKLQHAAADDGNKGDSSLSDACRAWWS